MCSFSTQSETHCHALHHATFYIRYIEYMKMLSHLFLMVHKAKYESSVSLTHEIIDCECISLFVDTEFVVVSVFCGNSESLVGNVGFLWMS